MTINMIKVLNGTLSWTTLVGTKHNHVCILLKEAEGILGQVLTEQAMCRQTV